MPLLPLFPGAGGSAGMPDRRLEVAFDTQPGEIPIWTDVTAYVRGLNTTRGRSRELDRYQAGRLSAVLDNRDRRFDPSNDQNRLSQDGASFETGTGDWSVTSDCSIARTTAQALQGSASLAVTHGSGLGSSLMSASVRASGGLTYTAVISARAATTGRGVSLGLSFLDTDGVGVGSFSDTDTDTSAGWTSLSVTGVAPTGTARVRLTVSIVGPSAGEVHYLDAAGILYGTTTWVLPAPYSGKILPMKRVRFIADGQTQFDGYVDSWNLNYDNPNDAFVDLQATDAFKVLAAADLKSSAYTQDVSGDAPQFWFRLGEPVGSTTVFDSMQALEGTVVGTATFGQTGLAGDDDTAVTMANANSGIRVTDSRAFLLGSSFTVEALIRTSEAATEVIWQQDGSSSCQIRLRMLASGLLEFQLTDTGSAYTAETESTGSVNDGATHHVAITFSTTNGLRVFVDGANVSNVVLTDTGTPVLTAFQTTLANDKSFLVNGWNGTLDEVAGYSRELSDAEIAAHASAALTPWEGDTSGERVERVLDEIGWRDDLRNIDAGESTLQAATLGVSVLSHLQQVAESEFGELFATRDGLIRFVQRSGLINLDNAATFGDSGSDLRYAEIAFDYSDQLIRNDVTVHRVDGVAQNVRDEGSIDAFLTQSYTRDQLLHDSDVLSRNAAEFIVSEYREPLLRVTQITLLPQHTSGGIFPAILSRDLGDYVTVKFTPPGGGAQITQESRIEGISHKVTRKFWETKWQLSAAYAGTCFLELDDGSGSAPCGLDDAALYF